MRKGAGFTQQYLNYSPTSLKCVPCSQSMSSLKTCYYFFCVCMFSGQILSLDLLMAICSWLPGTCFAQSMKHQGTFILAGLGKEITQSMREIATNNYSASRSFVLLQIPVCSSVVNTTYKTSHDTSVLQLACPQGHNTCKPRIALFIYLPTHLSMGDHFSPRVIIYQPVKVCIINPFRPFGRRTCKTDQFSLPKDLQRIIERFEPHSTPSFVRNSSAFRPSHEQHPRTSVAQSLLYTINLILPQSSAELNPLSIMPEPPTKRRKVRKGTRSCWECTSSSVPSSVSLTNSRRPSPQDKMPLCK
jgi:hypothetical protein